ncbi:ATP-binding protein [Halalkalibaculum sp. DA384]|uniref:ATP-binding protein n=1 Tax=Halalkalibaculum sp. DA384 TaxID=3373606 RepID=UPI003753E9FB
MLALHELIQVQEGDLAKKIIKESIGGFDLDQAARQLDYAHSIKNRSISEYKEFEKADANVKEQRDKQKEIKKEEAQLSDLYEQKQEAKEAAKRKELYDCVIAYKEAKLDFEQKEQRYQEFPEVLGKAHGEEYERIEGIEGEISDAERAVEQAERKQQLAQDILDQLEIPEAGVDDQDLVELEQRIANLEDWEEEISRLQGEIKKFEKNKEDILASLGEQPDITGWDGLKIQDLEDLDQFLEKAHRTASAHRFLKKEIEKLSDELNEDISSKSVLQKGINALSQWLQEPRVVSELPVWITISIIAITLLGGIGTFFWWQVGLAGFLLILGLSLYGLWKQKQEQVNPNVTIREDDYRETGLPGPADWEREDVRQKLNELIDELTEASWQERIAQVIEKRSDQIDDLQKQIRDVEETGSELKDRISALPELPFENPQDYNALYWFIIQAQKWQKADEEVRALTEQVASYKEQIKTELEKCNAQFEKYNAGVAADAAEAEARYQHLKKQEDKRQQAKKEVADQSDIIEEKQGLIQRKEDELKSIYNKLDVEFDRKDQVQALLNRLDDFKDARKDFEVSKQLLSEKQTAMESHSRYQEEQGKIEHMNLDQAEDERQQLEETAEKLDRISNQITEIETNVKSVKDGNSLENVLKEQDEALLELQGVYEENLSSIAGQLLVDQLKGEVREQNRPKVFHRANELFNRITKGRYEVRIDEKDEPEFRAYDTVEKEGKSLDQLSTGTRIQLLLSVRMAFVETQESSIKLPILADELLANSDDVRAQAIIEALTEISKDGRQVFYFTAQADEVAKWQLHLSDMDDIDAEIYTLSGNGQESEYRYDTEQFEALGLLHEVPETYGLSHKEYGELLDIPSYDTLLDEPEQLHLWYLIEDLKLLYQCLKQGIGRWGKLKSFLNHSGNIEGLDEDKRARLREKVRLLEQFQNLYRQGRPEPIDRSVLEDSGAVSDTFIDKVSDKLNELEGNPTKLLKALRNREVSGFYESNIEKLEDYLLTNEYIDGRDSMGIDHIQTRIQAYTTNLNIVQQEANMFLKRVLSD